LDPPPLVRIILSLTEYVTPYEASYESNALTIYEQQRPRRLRFLSLLRRRVPAERGKRRGGFTRGGSANR
jgi:hypothetical protein